MQEATAISFRPVEEHAAAAAPVRTRTGTKLQLFEEIGALEATWRSFQASADCTVFQSFDWLEEWQRHIGVRRDTKPAIVLGSGGAGQPLFLLPLAVEPRGWLRCLTWLGSDLCDYNAPLVASGFAAGLEPGQFTRLWHEILGVIRGSPQRRFDFVDLEKMPGDLGRQPNPFLDLRVRPLTCDGHVAELGPDWEEFYATTQSVTRRRADRRKVRRLAEQGRIRFVEAAEEGDIKRTLAALIDQKASSYARLGVENTLARPSYREFYHAIAANPTFRDVVHLSRVEIDDAWIATGLGLRFNSSYYLVMSSYEQGPAARYSPGRIHIQGLVRRAIEQGLTRFDFTIGDEPYKLEWTDTRVKLFRYQQGITVAGKLVVALRGVIQRAELLASRSPWLRRRLSAIIRIAGDGRRRLRAGRSEPLT